MAINKAAFFMGFPFASSLCWLSNRYNTGAAGFVAGIFRIEAEGISNRRLRRLGLEPSIFPARAHLRSDSLDRLCFDKRRA